VTANKKAVRYCKGDHKVPKESLLENKCLDR
jgi:hypothetical protein